MNDEKIYMKFHPAVPRLWLFCIAGAVWMAVGILLCTRAILWLSPYTIGMNIMMETGSLFLAIAGYIYGFSKIVQKNINRIHTLPARVCAFAFTPWRGYGMIALMVTLGITLRNSSVPKIYLAIPYFAMGSALLIGSQRLFGEFIALKKSK